jgi:hypothetical protein
MKRKIVRKIYWGFVWFPLFSLLFLTACATSKCDCEYNNKYSKRKSNVSLIDYQKNTTFALQKDKKIFLI